MGDDVGFRPRRPGGGMRHCWALCDAAQWRRHDLPPSMSAQRAAPPCQHQPCRASTSPSPRASVRSCCSALPSRDASCSSVCFTSALSCAATWCWLLLSSFTPSASSLLYDAYVSPRAQPFTPLASCRLLEGQLSHRGWRGLFAWSFVPVQVLQPGEQP